MSFVTFNRLVACIAASIIPALAYAADDPGNARMPDGPRSIAPDSSNAAPIAESKTGAHDHGSFVKQGVPAPRPTSTPAVEPRTPLHDHNSFHKQGAPVPRKAVAQPAEAGTTPRDRGDVDNAQ